MTGHARERGFTLIEILIVIAIIGILAGILLPALGVARQDAGRRVAQTEIRDLTLALGMYFEKWGNLPPDSGPGGELAALVVYLDGDTRNGGPRERYFSFQYRRVTPGSHYQSPVDGEPYHYDELRSENRPFPGDPAATPPAKVSIDLADIWVEIPGEPVSEWPSNFGR